MFVMFGCIPWNTKWEVLDCLVEWKALVEKLSGRKMKVLCTDNGGKYTLNNFDDFLKKKEVLHECAVPNPSEHNGIAEKFNSTLVEMVCSTLISDSKLPGSAFLRTLSPTKALEGTTPYKAWENKNELFASFWLWGFSKDERGKAWFKSKKMVIFLGYGQGTIGYHRLYDTNRLEVFYSRDVKIIKCFNQIKMVKLTITSL